MNTTGTVYEIRHIFNFSTYENMPQAWAARVCAEDRVECAPPNPPDTEQRDNARSINARQDTKRNDNNDSDNASATKPATDPGTNSTSSKRNRSPTPPDDNAPLLTRLSNNNTRQTKVAHPLQHRILPSESSNDTPALPPPAKRQHTSK
jgi:hypothetical protein